MNKVVLVTGSSRGIGKATIIEFANRGYNVVINYNNSEKEALELKKYIEENYCVNVLTLKADVSNEEEVKNMISTIINNFGRIDVLINNAGLVIGVDKEFEGSLDEWDIMMIPAVNKSDLPTYFIPFGTLEEMDTEIRFANTWMNGEQVYGVPSTCNAQGIVYNKAVYEAAGITELPKTPDEFINA